MTSPAPGDYVSVIAAPTPSTSPASTGVAFLVGSSPRGPVGKAVLVQSLSQFATIFGARVPYAIAYDWLDIFFRKGQSAYFSRSVGPAATTASLTLHDRAGSPLSTLSIKALGPGTDGNNIAVAVVNGSIANTYQLQVFYNGVLVETSTLLAAPADAVAWAAANSNYVTATDLVSATAAPNNNPAVIAMTSLSGGTDDNSSISDSVNIASLAAFTPDLGPGQVCVGGSTSATVHEAVLNHAQANNRVALNDAPDTATASTITALAGTEQAASIDPSYGTLLAPWVIYPGIPTGGPIAARNRNVPPSALAAANMAANDRSNDCNVAAAGPNGIDDFALDVTQTYSASDRAALNNAGVCVVRNIVRNGGVQLFGYRSLALDPAWTDLANVRFRMQIIDGGQQIGATFDFAQIDGQGKVASALQGALMAYLATFYSQGSLFGDTPADAFSVVVGPPINTPNTAAAKQLNAQISARFSDTAETVNIFVIKYGPNQSLPSAA